MNRLKNWTLIVLTVFLLALAGAYRITKNKLAKERSEKERWIENFQQVSSQNKQNQQIALTEKEFNKVLKDSLKLVLKQSNIPPRIVKEIVERQLTFKIDVPQLVPVSLISKNIWSVKDSTECFTWKGIAYLSDDSLKVKRIGFSFQNNSIDILHRRQKGKFLFWNTYYKNKFDLTTKSGCGTLTSKTINVIK